MKQKKILTVQDMVLIGMFTAILSILSQISFQLPGGIPITLQTFAVALLAIVLGAKLGTYSVLIYLLIGAVGFPVFANFKGGLSALAGPTGGYLIGFIFMAFITGLGKGKKFPLRILFSLSGLLVCHLLGLAVYGLITKTLLPTAPFFFIKDAVTIFFSLILGYQISKPIDSMLIKQTKQISL
ncbi:biotin transport system substrate-specific component [Mobilisporobacter senegalensis]|uniref:Biotin transporter n=1 Tax=Mobilisporobacter senegalensis TaxID=1329262 RepID=A0A3N1XNU4_9FIRM|nr:biotin transporter BioY [Mobilisporobacter senegalensis]ROR28344.1 biotin transport system substrate-specific component [Mobilisporobacter senegalensis]